MKARSKAAVHLHSQTAFFQIAVFTLSILVPLLGNTVAAQDVSDSQPDERRTIGNRDPERDGRSRKRCFVCCIPSAIWRVRESKPR